jgi:hypothetical protein
VGNLRHLLKTRQSAHKRSAPIAATRASALLLSAAAIVLLGGCTRSRETLVDNLHEGMHEQEVIQAMHQPPGAFRVVAETQLRKHDPRPPYSIRVLRAEGVQCAGQLSDVSLSFYLKQLHVVSCYPRNVDAMIDALIQAGYISTRGREFSVVRNGVSVSSAEIDGQWCVTFASERLTSDQRRWNMRYS